MRWDIGWGAPVEGSVQKPPTASYPSSEELLLWLTPPQGSTAEAMSNSRSLGDAEELLAEGIFRSLVGGVTDMLATTDGIARTQDALLSTSRGLLEELRLHDTARQADAINGRSEKIRETCAALERVSDRLAALRRRASVLEAELEADGCVAGDGVSELCL